MVIPSSLPSPSGQDVDRADGRTSQYLNIYSDWEPEFGASPLETLAQNWRHVELDFIPYQLQHAVVDINGTLDVSTGGRESKETLRFPGKIFTTRAE